MYPSVKNTATSVGNKIKNYHLLYEQHCNTFSAYSVTAFAFCQLLHITCALSPCGSKVVVHRVQTLQYYR